MHLSYLISHPLLHTHTLTCTLTLSLTHADTNTHPNTHTLLPHCTLTLALHTQYLSLPHIFPDQVANLPGFVGNRCIFTYALESMLLLETTESENIESDSSQSDNDEIGLGIGGLSVQRIDEALRYVQRALDMCMFTRNSLLILLRCTAHKASMSPLVHSNFTANPIFQRKRNVGTYNN